MKTSEQIIMHLQSLSNHRYKPRFFKVGINDYASHDEFIGVTVPALRAFAKELKQVPMCEIQCLIESKINEHRFLALILLVDLHKQKPAVVYDFYMANLRYVNNWNLVDASAHLIVGSYLLENESTDILVVLANSDILWERRIAIVSTWFFIRLGKFDETIRIAEILLRDSHDLIHKATGWMLREMGKRNESVLCAFLSKHAGIMPRTMLRYAIEKMDAEQKKMWLATKKL